MPGQHREWFSSIHLLEQLLDLCNWCDVWILAQECLFQAVWWMLTYQFFCQNYTRITSKFTHCLLCAFMIPSLPKALSGLKDLTDHCTAAELKHVLFQHFWSVLQVPLWAVWVASQQESLPCYLQETWNVLTQATWWWEVAQSLLLLHIVCGLFYFYTLKTTWPSISLSYLHLSNSLSY